MIYKVLGQTTSGLLFRAPDETVVSLLSVCNRSTSSNTYTITVNGTSLFSNQTIPGNDTHFLNLGITLGVGDTISVSGSGISFSAYGTEVWNPTALFSLGEEGAWYDPSDVGTMFESFSGTGDVSEGDPVGLIRDKSANFLLGPELVTFSGPYNMSSGNLNLSLSEIIPTNKFVRIAVDLTYGGTNSVKPTLWSNGTVVYSPGSTRISSFDIIVFTTNEANTFILQNIGTATDTIINSVSIKQVLGYTARQTTSTARPTYNNATLSFDSDDNLAADYTGTGGFTGTLVHGFEAGVVHAKVSVPDGSYSWFTNPSYKPNSPTTGYVLREGTLTSDEVRRAKEYFGDARFSGVTSMVEWFRGRTDLVELYSGDWDISSVTSFYRFALGCTSLTTVTVTGGTGNPFADSPCTNYTNAFTNTNLDQTSIDDILVAIEAANTSNGTFNQSGGSAPSATGEAAVDALRSRGWTVTVTGGY